MTRSTTIQRPWVKTSTGGHHTRSHNKFYQTTRWRKDRALHIAANPLCVACAKENMVEPSVVSDHIISIEMGGDPWAWSNRQALCQSHHNKKSANEKQ